MSDFFEQYGWLVCAMIGGYIGLTVLIDVFFLDNSSMAYLISTILKGMM